MRPSSCTCFKIITAPRCCGRRLALDALAKLSRLYEAREAAEAMGGEEDADVVAEQLGKDAQTILELGRAFEARYYGHG